MSTTPRFHQPIAVPAAAGSDAPLEHRRFAREVPGPAAQTKKATILICITMPRVAKSLPRAARFIA